MRHDYASKEAVVSLLGRSPTQQESDRLSTPAPRRPRRSLRRSRGLWLVLPALAIYVAIVLVPSVQGVMYSFTDWNGIARSWDFIGLQNYVALFNDPHATRAVTNTLLLAVVTTVLENIIGLLLALGVNSRIKTRNALRLAFFAPVIVLSVVVASLWKYILAPDGVVNMALQGLGVRQPPNWLGDPSLALMSIIVVVIWQYSGYCMVIYLAGLQSVPVEQLEAAALDGAGPVRTFWSVVRPLLAPALIVNLVLSGIRGLMMFDQIWVLTQGGPAQQTETLSTLVYRNAFVFGDFAYSTAVAVLLAILVGVISAVQYRSLAKGR